MNLPTPPNEQFLGNLVRVFHLVFRNLQALPDIN